MADHETCKCKMQMQATEANCVHREFGVDLTISLIIKSIAYLQRHQSELKMYTNIKYIFSVGVC